MSIFLGIIVFMVYCPKVEIGLLHDLGYATTVATEPLTADDWEILVSLSRY